MGQSIARLFLGHDTDRCMGVPINLAAQNGREIDQRLRYQCSE